MAFAIGHQRHFMLRAKENRKLQRPVFGHAYLFEAIRQAPSLGERQVDIAGTANRKPRTATVQMAYRPVCLALPAIPAGEYPPQPLHVWAIRVWEPHPPQGEEALAWILLTNVPVTNLAAVQERIGWYKQRPIVEEYHKGMKTGCSIVLQRKVDIAQKGQFSEGVR